MWWGLLVWLGMGACGVLATWIWKNARPTVATSMACMLGGPLPALYYMMLLGMHSWCEGKTGNRRALIAFSLDRK